MGVILTHRSHIGIVRVLLGIVGLQASGGLVLIISPSSELGIVHHFFYEFLFLQGIFLQNFKIIYQPTRLVLKGSVYAEFIKLCLNLEHLSLFWSYLPYLNSESHSIFFLLVSLFFKEHSIKFSKIFSTGSTGCHPVQLVHQVSLYEAGGFGTQILLGSSP